MPLSVEINQFMLITQHVSEYVCINKLCFNIIYCATHIVKTFHTTFKQFFIYNSNEKLKKIVA